MTSRPRLPPGVPAILASVFGMALADALIKKSSGGMSLWQIWVLRSALVLPVMFVLARGRVGVPNGGWVALRSFALIAMYLAMYSALPLIDMALAGAAFYTAPLFIVGLSSLILGNRVTVRHWLAILIGFAGLLAIVRPFGAAFSPLVLMPVAAAAFYACAAILTRVKCAGTAPVALGFWLNVAFLGFGAAALAGLSAGLALPLDYPFLTGPWIPMTAGGWTTIAVLAVLMLGIAVGVAKAYQSPRPEVIASFDYAYMIFAVLWGFVFFGEVPDRCTLAGMALITAGGMVVLDADRKRRRMA